MLHYIANEKSISVKHVSGKTLEYSFIYNCNLASNADQDTYLSVFFCLLLWLVSITP